MFDVAKDKFEKIFTNKISTDEAKKYLIELYKRGESAEEIAAATEVMREHSIKLIVAESLRDKLIDVVGTGGDKSNSFNISSTVSLLLPTLGCFVAKHGNRAITSNSGSADMLEALGINLNLNPQKQSLMLAECGFTFLFAINHHPAMKYIMPIRKSLDHRTISLLDTKSAVAVSSRDGMDEISISDVTYATMLKNNRTTDFIIDPAEYGFKLAPKEAIVGGNAKENAQITLDILKGDETGARRDIILLNTAMALLVDDKARDIKEGIEMALDAIQSKKAIKKLEEIIRVSNTL